MARREQGSRRRLLAAAATSLVAITLAAACQATGPAGTTGATSTAAGGAASGRAPEPAAGSRDAMLLVKVEVPPEALAAPGPAYRLQAAGRPEWPMRAVPRPKAPPQAGAPKSTVPPRLRPTLSPRPPATWPTVEPSRRPSPRPSPTARPAVRPANDVAAALARRPAAQARNLENAGRPRFASKVATVLRTPDPAPRPRPPRFSARTPAPSASPKVVLTVYGTVKGLRVPIKRISKPVPAGGGQVDMTLSGLQPGKDYTIKTSVVLPDKRVTASAIKRIMARKGQNLLQSKPTFLRAAADLVASHPYSVRHSGSGPVVRAVFPVMGEVRYQVIAGSSTAGCGPGYSLRFGFLNASTREPDLTGSGVGQFYVTPLAGAGALYVESTLAGMSSAGRACSQVPADTWLTIEKVGAADVIAR